MPEAVADSEPTRGVAALGLATGVGEAFADSGDARADCAVPDLEAEPSFADLLQAIAKTRARMRIMMLSRFIKNLLLSMSMTFDNPLVMLMPRAAQSAMARSY